MSPPSFPLRILSALVLSLTLAAPTLAADAIRFNRDVRPVLSDNCFACHGPDAHTVKGDLRLDLRENAVAANKHGRRAIVPGDPATSELVKRIQTTDADEIMPPPEAHKTLTAEQKKLLHDWIAQGAEYERHWAYEPMRRPEPPAVRHADWARGPIDRFILARLEAERLAPSAPADRITLIRRLSFDLTGLPPAPAEVDAFVNDTSADAVEKVVDRLLASPHFGERMAIYWLDLVRYADTNGYHGDNPRRMSLYRDYVIEAFNKNKAYDRFLIEQVAGDMLPDADRETRIASAFNRLLQTTQEGGAQAKEYFAKYAADRVRNTSAALLGSTIGCAECHDHKYDPFTAKDFYAFGAFFADIDEAAVGGPNHTKMPDAAEEERLAALDAQIAERERALATLTPQLREAMTSWEAAASATLNRWTTLEPAQLASTSDTTFTRLDDGSWLVGGEPGDKETYTVTLTAALAPTALRIEVLPHESLPKQGPGRAANGNFVLHAFDVRVGDQPITLHRPTATHQQDKFPVAHALNGKGWAILPHVGKTHAAVFEIDPKTPIGPGQTVTVTLRQDWGGGATIGRFRLSATTDTPPVRVNDGLPGEIVDILHTPDAERTDKQRAALTAHFLATTELLNDDRRELEVVKKQRKDFYDAVPDLVVTQTRAPREMRVLPRGNWLDDSGAVVQPAIPEFLGALDTGDRRATRLDLAKWIASADNPLTARVWVNRVWMLMIGRGLSPSVDDFGGQGSPPSHPELLDWLATDFVEHGWDTKRLIRQIALSATYLQTSKPAPTLRERDPYNALVARQGRWRIEAEMVRDNALALSGLLVETVGGASAHPYQPAGYWMHLKFPNREYKHDSGDDQYRRGLYTWWQRTFLHPAMLAFDAPTREECTAKRVRSNTPLQALVLLNDPSFVEAARKLAERIVREGGDTPEARIGWVMRLATSREAAPAERDLLGTLYTEQRAAYAADPEAAKKLLGVGLAARDEALDPVELAAWTQVARAVLNLHETITRY